MSKEEVKKAFDQELMNEVVAHVQQVMGIIDEFEPSRSNEKAFTHLEEALFWMQVMIANVPKKAATGATTTLDSPAVEGILC